MSGSFLVCAGLLCSLSQEPAADLQQPSAMAAPEVLPYSTMLEWLHDYRWMIMEPRKGEGVESQTLILDPGAIQRIELEGPGAVSHLWLSSQEGKIRIYVDGADQPTLNWDLVAFAEHGMPQYLPNPLALPLGLGWDVHLPLPFASSMAVEFEAPAHLGMKVQLDVRDFGEGVVFDSVSEASLLKDLAQIERVAEIIRTGERPPSQVKPDPFKVGATRTQEVNPETGVSGEFFWFFRGKGMVRWLEITFIHKEGPAPVEEMLRGLKLRLEHHVEKPLQHGKVLLEVPLGDLFGSSLGANPFQSYAVGLDAQTGTFHLRLPIPFEDGMRLVITSDFPEYARLGARIGLDVYEEDADLPPLRLHAGWMRARETGSPKGATLRIDGPAHIAGYTLASTSPSLQPMAQTGAFAFADFWTSPAPGAYQHVTRRDGPLGYGHNSMVRTFGLDAPSSADGLSFHPGVVFPEADGPTDYSAFAWFYALEDTKYSMSTQYPLEQRMPPELPKAKFLIAEGAMEAEEAPGVSLSEGSAIEVKTVIDTSQRWSRLQFTHFQPSKASDMIVFPFALNQSGKYAIHAQLAKGEAYGQCELLVDGRAVGMVFSGEGEGLTPSGELEITTMRMMARNDHSLALRSLDGKAIGIDYFRIVPVKPKSEGAQDSK